MTSYTIVISHCPPSCPRLLSSNKKVSVRNELQLNCDRSGPREKGASIYCRGRGSKLTFSKKYFHNKQSSTRKRPIISPVSFQAIIKLPQSVWTIPPHVCLSRPSIKDPSIYCRERDRFGSNSSIYFCVPAHFFIMLSGIITASVKVNRSCRCARLSFSKNDPYIYDFSETVFAPLVVNFFYYFWLGAYLS